MSAQPSLGRAHLALKADHRPAERGDDQPYGDDIFGQISLSQSKTIACIHAPKSESDAAVTIAGA
ncbi:hypothetical protein D3C73_1659640 [compost metagenome]